LRILIVIAVALLALIAGGLVAVSNFVVWDDYRDELTAQAEAMTGRRVAIQGRIDLTLLPRPTLTLGQTTLASRADADDGVRLEVDRLDLRLKPLPLLGGRLDVAGVRLVRPVWQLDSAAEGFPKLMQLTGLAAWLPLTPGGPSRVSVVDGRAVLPEFTRGQPGQLEQLNLDLSTVEPSGAVVLGGTFSLNGQAFRADARFGPLSGERSNTLRLELTTVDPADAGASTLTFGGVVWWRADAPRLRGELAVAGADARSTIGAVGKAAGQQIVPMPSWVAAPFRLTGRVGLEQDRLDLAEFALELDGAEVKGRLRLILAALPEIELDVTAPRLGLAGGLSADNLQRDLAPFLALASSVRGEIDLAVSEIETGPVPVHRLRTSVQLSGDGSATIKDARAVLPGETDVSFAGRFTGAGADAQLRGKLTAVTENLRPALAWLDLSPHQVPQGRLNSLTLASDVSLRHNAWRFSALELRVDATRVTGSAAVNWQPRAQIAANLVLDRFDLDAYWPDRAPADLLAGLAGPLGTIDAAIQAQLARLTWRGVHLQDVGLAGRSVKGRLRIDELTVGDLADAEARVAGQIDLANGAFDLSAELRNAQPARVLRRMGFAPSPLLARLPPLTLEGRATGPLEAAHLELEARDGAGKIDLAGQIGWAGRQAHYEFDVAAQHPDYRELLQDLGAASLPPEPSAAPLSLAGKVQREVGGAAQVAGTAQLGETSFTGKVAWQADQARPYIAARISVGQPTAPLLGGLLDLGGLRLEWPTPHGGFRGRWSERPFALPLLDRVDGELVLSSKGGLAGEGLELNARLEEGRLTVEHVSLALWQGRLHGQLSFDARRPLPHLIAALDLEAFDPAELAAWLGVPPIVAGPASLRVQATGAGDNVRALVGSLMGEVELAAADGPALGALPDEFTDALERPSDGQDGAAEPAGLDASFPLERGILVAQPTHLDFGDITTRLEGAVDLYLWAIDLTLRSPAGGPALKLVGKLHRPQVRLIGAAGPEQAAPAPSASP
jgi:AsmA family/AsmA-like C-terminal region